MSLTWKISSWKTTPSGTTRNNLGRSIPFRTYWTIFLVVCWMYGFICSGMNPMTTTAALLVTGRVFELTRMAEFLGRTT
ncbi:MAG: hypothetical protein BWX71_02813 [Deltaproteobacteria bacterium ADurb.Bin072]|nr:MAG: hypothetical protein BWX71_02813 [Deltaproteobacteria bacterium ADurb.Bin072]